MGSEDAAPCTLDLVVENVKFDATVTPPKSIKKLVLAGAGVRGVQINPQLFIKVSTLGFYFEEEVISYLAKRWSGKANAELLASEEFFADIIASPFEKFSRVVMLRQLTGPEYTAKVAEHAKHEMIAIDAFGEEEEKACEEFCEIIKDQVFTPGTGPFYIFTADGKLGIAFSQDGSIPQHVSGVINNRNFADIIQDSIIGKSSICPDIKGSIVERIALAPAQFEKYI